MESIDDEKLFHIGNEFWRELSKLVGHAVSQFPKEQEMDVLEYLSDQSSVLGSDWKKYVKRWTCPDHPKADVIWSKEEESLAVCQECGRTNKYHVQGLEL